MNALVTVQIATGDTNLVSNVRMNLVNDVQSGAILVRCRAPACVLLSLHHSVHVGRVGYYLLPCDAAHGCKCDSQGTGHPDLHAVNMEQGQCHVLPG